MAIEERKEENCSHLQKSLPLCPACAAGVDFAGETSTVLSSPKEVAGKEQGKPTA